MNKSFFRNAVIYLLALANFAYALRHGFTWLHYVTFVLTGLAAVFDVWEVMHRGRQ